MTSGSSNQRKTYVLDTSVLLADPKAYTKFAEHDVVIPLTVITELEKKRHDIDLGYFARTALRSLEELRNEFGTLTEEIPLAHGGTVRVEVESIVDMLPDVVDKRTNDAKIIATAMGLAGKVVVVSKDLPMRLISSSIGMASESYRAEIKSTEEWSGMAVKHVGYPYIEKLYANGDVVISDEGEELPVNTGVILKSGTSSALTIYTGNGNYVNVSDVEEVFEVKARSAEQKIALAHLLRDDVGIVSIGGNAGTGKSAMALLAGLQAVLEDKRHKKIIIFRPLYSVGGQDLGFLPGDRDEKMNPWAQAVFDTLEPLVSKEVLDEVISRDMIEILPLTHIRGRSLHDAFVIVDEAQSLERNVLLTVLSRIGRNSKVVLTHDVAQRDNLMVGRYDGVVSVVEALKGNSMFAHVTLRKSERSAIAELVTSLLDF